MNLTKTLISYLNRVFDKNPYPFLAIRINCDGSSLAWSIADGPSIITRTWDDGITQWDEPSIIWDGNQTGQTAIPGTSSFLTLTPTGGTAAPITIDLAFYTISELATFIATQSGYSVPYVDTSSFAALSSQVLINTSGNTYQPNGDMLFGYSNFLWAYMDAQAAELETAQRQISAMPAQMNTVQAQGSWLDFLGSYYGVPRQPSEFDQQYGPRIIATVIRPLGNNVAIESALRVLNGGLGVSVTDYTTLTNNSYGLFVVNFILSLEMLNAQSFSAWETSIATIISTMRDAGTFPQSINIITPIEGSAYITGVVKSGSTSWIYPG